MSNINEQFGQNAGKVWRTLNSHSICAEDQLIRETNLSNKDFYVAIGWLARENKIFQKEKFFALSENELQNINIGDGIKPEEKKDTELTFTKEIIEIVEAVNKIQHENEETLQETSSKIVNPEPIVNKEIESGVKLTDEPITETPVNFENITNEENHVSSQHSFGVSESTTIESLSDGIDNVKSDALFEETEEVSVIKNEAEIKESNVSNEPKEEDDFQENVEKIPGSSSLDKAIDKINKVSRMTEAHLAFKDEEITGLSEEISRWNLPNLQKGTCDLCGELIEFEENLSGLTVGGNFFACEKCCKNTSKEGLTLWTKSKMNNPGEVRPIGLWVIQEKNKDHSVLKNKKN